MKRLPSPGYAALPLLTLFASTLPAGGAPPAAGTAGAPAIVERAAAANAVNLRGVIGMQRHFATTISAGPLHHTEISESGQLLEDGAFVKIKYYHIARDGRAFSHRQLARRDARTNRDWAAGKIFFKEPYDRRFMADYRFEEAACGECPSGTVAVKFSSSMRDIQHGNGTLWIESATALVERVSYSPNALPPHASSGMVTEIYADAPAGIRYPTRISQIFYADEALLRGSGTFTGTFDHLRRFPTVADGVAALNAGTI